MMEQNQIIIYQTPNGETTIDVKIEHETISIGYRVKSKEGTQFRIWANKI